MRHLRYATAAGLLAIGMAFVPGRAMASPARASDRPESAHADSKKVHAASDGGGLGAKKPQQAGLPCRHLEGGQIVFVCSTTTATTTVKPPPTTTPPKTTTSTTASRPTTTQSTPPPKPPATTTPPATAPRQPAFTATTARPTPTVVPATAPATSATTIRPVAVFGAGAASGGGPTTTVVGPAPAKAVSGPPAALPSPPPSLKKNRSGLQWGMALVSNQLSAKPLQAATTLSIPIVLCLLVLVFLVCQGQLDKRDPKLSKAPFRRDDDALSFS